MDSGIRNKNSVTVYRNTACLGGLISLIIVGVMKIDTNLW